MKIKFKPRKIKITQYPTFIVGENPGKPTRGQTSFEVWRGNRGATLVNKAIEGRTNLYLTNVYNWYVDKKDSNIIFKGIKELVADINKYKPVKIVCLGNFAYDTIRNINLYETTVIYLPHPSYIFRFNLNKKAYVENLKSYLP